MDFLSNIFVSIVMYYWNAISGLSYISSIYSEMTTAGSWLTDLNTNMRELCVDTLMEAFEGIGLAVALTYFLISIIGLVTEDRFTPEFLVKFFAKLVISVAVIMWSGSLLTGIVDFGDAMGGMFSNVTAESFKLTSKDGEKKDIHTAFETFITNFTIAAAKELNCTFKSETSPISWSEDVDKGKICTYYPDFEKTDETAGLVKCLGIGISMCIAGALLCIVSMIGIPVIMAAIVFVELSRMIELYIRGCLLPIAAGVMADDGWRGAGGRYFKKVLALATQKVVLSLTCVLTSAMTTKFLLLELETVKGDSIWLFIGNSFVMIITAIAIALAGISFMFKSLQVVNDLWGAS